MTKSTYKFSDIGITIECSTFKATSGVNEHHFMLHVSVNDELFAGQYRRLCEGEARLLALP